ncbi:MAG: glycogen synthase GlgA [Hyphomicrobiaceae bacterium]|nr:glycogen synthase GlgA [Hyphomicrobiaceae bacterium]
MSIRVLAVASEAFPLIKTGGLADVVGALPAALAAHGVAVTTLLPGYPAVMAALADRADIAVLPDLYGGPAHIRAGRAGPLDLFVLDAPHLFDRPGNPYVGPAGTDWPDNPLRFAALAQAAEALARGMGSVAPFDLVHCHDWQAGLVPAYLAASGERHQKTVMTVHNLAFQGQFPAELFPRLGLPDDAFSVDGVEYYGMVGYLKGGLRHADAITTVSPTYAAEIMTPACGMGLEGLIAGRADVVSGIVNGIDPAVWSPAADPDLPATFDARTLSARKQNRLALETRFGLDHDKAPLFCVVSRLTWQKGLDLLEQALPTLIRLGAKLALLGSGDRSLETAFRDAATRHHGRVGVIIGYDEALSHLMVGGADAILVPSRFEPCGLTQLYGLAYGCVPVVSRVGGLADTVIDANDAALEAGVATGVQFTPVDVPSLEMALRRTVALHADTALWRRIQKRGMAGDLGWDRRAKAYADLFRSLLKS